MAWRKSGVQVPSGPLADMSGALGHRRMTPATGWLEDVKRRSAGPALAIVVAVAGGVALAGQSSSTAVRFTTTRTRASTGLVFDARFGSDAAGKPRALVATRLHLPAGTRVDTRAVAVCPLVPSAIVGAGGAGKVCPPASNLGTGTAEVYIADHATPAVLTIDVRNVARTLVLELDHRGVPAFVVAATIRGSTIASDLAVLRTLGYKVGRIEFSIGATGSRSNPYLRTPTACPSGGRWRGSLESRFADGTIETHAFAIRCAPTH